MAREALHDGAPIFEFDARIRYSEVDHRGRLSLPALINYFQDSSTFQAQHLGIGMGRLKEERHGWVLTHWQIMVDRYPSLYETVTVGTFASSFRGVMATRFFYLRDAAGELIARARSTWVFMDFAKGRPARPDAETLTAYGTAKPLSMPTEERRVRLPEALAPCETVRVRLSHIDTNEHVNNCQYAQMALDVLPRELDPSQVRVDYRRSAVLGDIIHPSIGTLDGAAVVALNDADGNPYAVIEIR